MLNCHFPYFPYFEQLKIVSCQEWLSSNFIITVQSLPSYVPMIWVIKNYMVSLMFSTHDELLTSGAKIEKLIVAHPALDDPIEIQILYIAYEGWIYSGR